MVDLANLHPGIDQYYRGHVRPDSSTARTARTKPLNLLHYTGSDMLGEVMIMILIMMIMTVTVIMMMMISGAGHLPQAPHLQAVCHRESG